MPKLRVNNIKDAGNLDRERVIIPVDIECNIGSYMLVRARSASDSLLGGSASLYWFPNYDLPPGDLIVLYTKPGKYKIKNTDKGKTHFFYWGLKQAIWNDSSFGAALGVFTDYSSWKMGGFTEDSDVEPEEPG